MISFWGVDHGEVAKSYLGGGVWKPASQATKAQLRAAAKKTTKHQPLPQRHHATRTQAEVAQARFKQRWAADPGSRHELGFKNPADEVAAFQARPKNRTPYRSFQIASDRWKPAPNKQTRDLRRAKGGYRRG